MENPTPGTLSSYTRFLPKKIWHAACLFFFFVIVFGPCLALIAETAKAIVSGRHFDWLMLVIPSGRTLQLLVTSMTFALCVAIGGTIAGFLIAFFIWRSRNTTARYLAGFLILLFPIPAYVHTLAWLSATSNLSAWVKAHGLSIPFLEGWIGAWWIQVITLLPLSVLLSLVGLYSVSPLLIDASRLVRSGIVTLTRVILPTAAPALYAGAGLLLVLSLADYSVPSLFSKNVYALEIFAEYSASSVTAKAFLLSLPLLCVCTVAIIISQSRMRSIAEHITIRRSDYTMLEFPRWFVWLEKGALAVLLAAVTVLLGSLILSAGSVRTLIAAVATARREIIFSFGIAAASALLSVPLGWVLAQKLVSERKSSWVWWFIVVLPLAIPASLVGIGIIAMYNREALQALYTSSWMPISAALARFSPFAALILMAQLRRVDRAQFDAARVYEKNALHGWCKVKLPVFLPAIFSACLIVFALTLGELGATLVVAPPGKQTLTMRIYNFMHYGASREVAGLCLIMTLMVFVAGGIVIASAGKRGGR